MTIQSKKNLAPSDPNFTELHLAAKNGNHIAVDALLKADATIVNKQCAGATALYLAAENGYVEVVKILLKTKNINIDAVYENQAKPMKMKPMVALHVAEVNGHTEVVKVICMRKLSDYLCKNEKEIKQDEEPSSRLFSGQQSSLKQKVTAVRALFDSDLDEPCFEQHKKTLNSILELKDTFRSLQNIWDKQPASLCKPG